MIRLKRSNTHANGEPFDTIEVWREDEDKTNETLIILIALDKDEPVVVEMTTP